MRVKTAVELVFARGTNGEGCGEHMRGLCAIMGARTPICWRQATSARELCARVATKLTARSEWAVALVRQVSSIFCFVECRRAVIPTHVGRTPGGFHKRSKTTCMLSRFMLEALRSIAPVLVSASNEP